MINSKNLRSIKLKICGVAYVSTTGVVTFTVARVMKKAWSNVARVRVFKIKKIIKIFLYGVKIISSKF